MTRKGADHLLASAIKLFHADKLVEAERLFKAVVDALGEESEALAHLSLIALKNGHLDDALDYGERATKANKDNPAAFHHLGLVYQGLNRFDLAAQAFARVVELAPGHLGARRFFARNLRAMGAGAQAADAFVKLVNLAPRDAEIAFEAAVTLQQFGYRDEAAHLYVRVIADDPIAVEAFSNLSLCGAPAKWALIFQRRAMRLWPDNLEVVSNLGNTLVQAGLRDEAIEVLSTVVTRAPLAANARFNLAAAYGAQDPAASMVLNAQALVLAPEFASAWNNIAGHLVRAGHFRDGARINLRALAADPTTDRSRNNAGLALMYDGDVDGAATLLTESLIFRRASGFWPRPLAHVPAVPDDPTFFIANALKLRHDAEQLRFLRARDLIDPELEQAAIAYDEIRAEIEAAQGQSTVGLPPQVRQRIAGVYNRVVYFRDTPARSQPVIADFDRAQVLARYAEPPGITWVDGLLTQEVLAELLAFCQESTIWFDLSHNFFGQSRGYLGALVNDGFCCPLLFQVAEAMRQALPDIFRDYPLKQLWAYKGDPELQALDAHADAAAVNVNFWITPDDANLDPETGGLTVWTAEAPEDWDFATLNSDQAAMTKLLEAPGVRRIDVPYRQNRALIFNSDLIHQSQPVRFKPGYENRRINITMLFGTRDKDWQRRPKAAA